MDFRPTGGSNLHRMPYDFRSQRLFVEADLGAGAHIELNREQVNYLLNVLRLKDGDGIILFNGRDGEWRASVAGANRKNCTLALGERLRDQTPVADLHYLFAP